MTNLIYFVIRFTLTFLAEFLFSFPSRKSILCVGFKPGSIGAWLNWCYTVAYFCARHQHPIRVCLNRPKWCDWMLEGE